MSAWLLVNCSAESIKSVSCRRERLGETLALSWIVGVCFMDPSYKPIFFFFLNNPPPPESPPFPHPAPLPISNPPRPASDLMRSGPIHALERELECAPRALRRPPPRHDRAHPEREPDQRERQLRRVA